MEKQEAVEILERCFTENVPTTELAEAVKFAIDYMNKPVEKDQTQKDLEELLIALRSKSRAEYEIQRLQGYRFKTPAMKSDLSRWHLQLETATTSINRTCMKHN